MNAARRSSGLAVAFLMLTACASAPVATLQDTGSHQVIDQDYVDAVEEATRTASVRVRVVWVNPPRETELSD